MFVQYHARHVHDTVGCGNTNTWSNLIFKHTTVRYRNTTNLSSNSFAAMARCLFIDEFMCDILRIGNFQICELLRVHGQIPVLIHELISIETWKAHAFPLCKGQIKESASVRSYILVRTPAHPFQFRLVSDLSTFLLYFCYSLQLYHEAVIVNLLGILLFNESAVEALYMRDDDPVEGMGLTPSEALLELIDYCFRKAQQFNLGYKKMCEFFVAVCCHAYLYNNV